jgi:hypothetical protein
MYRETVEELISTKLERPWREVVVTSFKGQFRYLPEGTSGVPKWRKWIKEE